MTLKIPQTIFEEYLAFFGDLFAETSITKIYFISEKDEVVFCLIDKAQEKIVCQYKSDRQHTLSWEQPLVTMKFNKLSLLDILRQNNLNSAYGLFNSTLFSYYGEINITKYVYLLGSIGVFTLIKSDYGNYVDHSLEIDLNEDCKIVRKIMHMLNVEPLVQSKLDNFSILQLLKNDMTHYDLCRDELNKILGEIKRSKKDCNTYDIKALNRFIFTIQSNVDNLEEVINQYFKDYAFVEPGSSSRKPDIIAIKSDTIRNKISNIVQNMEYAFKFKIINHAIPVVRDDGCLFFNINNDYIIGQKVFCGKKNNEWSFYLYERCNNTWHIFLKEKGEPSENESVPRIVRSFIPHIVEKQYGLNLHAAALMWEEKWSVLIVGDKYQGKTTNMFIGLSCVDEFDFQSNDQVFLLGDGILETYGSHIPIGVRIGTLKLHNDVLQRVKDHSYVENLRASKNGYAYQYLSTDAGDESFDSFTIFFTPRELTSLLGKKVIPSGELLALVQPIYDPNIANFEIEEMSVEEKRCLIINNKRPLYNGTEPFWNILLNYFDDLGTTSEKIADSLLNKINVIPGYKIKSNKNNIKAAWKYFAEQYLRNAREDRYGGDFT